jgi:hypothetical protein
MLKTLTKIWQFVDPSSEGSAYITNKEALNSTKKEVFLFRLRNRWAVK